MRRLALTLTAVTVAALALAGCTTQASAPHKATHTAVDAAKTPAAPKNHFESTWTAKYHGAVITVNLSTNPDEPIIARLNKTASKLKVTPPTWVIVSVDNTNGTKSVDVPSITVVQTDGKQIASEDTSDLFNEWSDASNALGDDSVDVYNEMLQVTSDAGPNLKPGAKGIEVEPFTTAPTSARFVYIVPSENEEEISARAK